MPAVPAPTRPLTAAPAAAADVQRWREDFPILGRSVRGRPLVYLDNAATTQKPRQVIDAITRYYESANANIHRGVHTLSQEATGAYELAREKVRRFMNAGSAAEIIFTRGSTEGINLVAATYGRANLRAGDEIVLSAMEHHSNIVPWQILCEQTGAKLRVVGFDDRGELLIEEYEKSLNERTRIVAMVHVSNSLGTLNPVKRVIELAHARNAVVLLDGAQAVSHRPTDVRGLDVDFYVFSGHKLYGPTGIGVLYGKRSLLEGMPPYQSGGDMIRSVSFAKTEYADLPNKFEAGTPHIAGGIGLGAAIDYVQSIGLERIAAQESAVLRHAADRMSRIPGVRLIGTAAEKASVISFVVESPAISTLDVGMELDARGIAVRTGHHCCQPVMDRFEIAGTARASFALYNTIEEADVLVEALEGIIGRKARRGGTEHSPERDELIFPEAAAESPEAAAEQLAEDFAELGDRDAQNQYVLDMGEHLSAMPAALKTGVTRVHGCMSVVHLHGRKRPGSDDRLDFVADSDAHIVRGLIAVLQRLFSGQKAEAILSFDVEKFFGRIGLDQFISSQRRNGLAGMVKRIRSLASKLMAGEPVA